MAVTDSDLKTRRRADVQRHLDDARRSIEKAIRAEAGNEFGPRIESVGDEVNSILKRVTDYRKQGY